jgi:hypothetical protein
MTVRRTNKRGRKGMWVKGSKMINVQNKKGGERTVLR